VGIATKAKGEKGSSGRAQGLPAEDGKNRETRRFASGVKGKSKGAPKNKPPPLPPPPTE
jgi:hypothetical protein